MEEDFYYSRENAIYYIKRIVKKALLFVLITASVASFLYITINAYYFADKEKDNSIRIIKSPNQEIKIKVKKDLKTVLNIDKVIYKNIVGNDKEIFEKKNAKIVKNIKTPKYQNAKSIKKEASNIKIKKEQKIIDLSPQKPKKALQYGTRVQVAAMGSKDAAEKYWRYISKNNSNLVKNYDRYITKIDLGKRGIFYRLQIGNFKTQNKAEQFCQSFILKNNKDESDCIILD
ncbi:SPOR domain-containing protein [Rickettsiales bacterium]|nr:SPOR domain-containing protein [Rickettsiales bacterium]